MFKSANYNYKVAKKSNRRFTHAELEEENDIHDRHFNFADVRFRIEGNERKKKMIREKEKERMGDEKEENYKNNKTQESPSFCSFFTR